MLLDIQCKCGVYLLVGVISMIPIGFGGLIQQNISILYFLVFLAFITLLQGVIIKMLNWYTYEKNKLYIFYATTDITAGDEILTFYGNLYWSYYPRMEKERNIFKDQD